MIKVLDNNNIYNEVHTLRENPHSFWLVPPGFETTVSYSVGFLNKDFRVN